MAVCGNRVFKRGSRLCRKRNRVFLVLEDSVSKEYVALFSLCKKTSTTSLFSFLKQSFTKSKLLDFKNFESLVFGAFLSKTGKALIFLLALFTIRY